MTKFIAIFKDKNKGALTIDLLNQHVAHLREQTKKGNIFLCGPFNDNDGAIQILEVKSKDIVESIINQYPFIQECYYQSFEIFELIEANETNNWLLEDSQTIRNMNK